MYALVRYEYIIFHLSVMHRNHIHSFAALAICTGALFSLHVYAQCKLYRHHIIVASITPSSNNPESRVLMN